MPTTIVITNDSDIEQPFAVCTLIYCVHCLRSIQLLSALVTNDEHVQSFSPIVMFNRIPCVNSSNYPRIENASLIHSLCSHGQDLHVEAELQLRAFLGRDLKRNVSSLLKCNLR